MPRLTLASLVLLSLACSADGPLSPAQTAQLAEAYATWKSAPREHYRIEVRQTCFCPAGNEWARLEVSHDSVLTLTLVSGDSVPPVEWEAWPTVDGMFERLRQGAAGGLYDEVTFWFDPAVGFPLRATLSPPSEVLDGGLTMEARNYESLSP